MKPSIPSTVKENKTIKFEKSPEKTIDKENPKEATVKVKSHHKT
jgi:hypothetical protein